MAKKYTKDDIDKFHDYEIWLPDNTMYIGSHQYVEDEESGVDHFMAERVIKNLHILDRTLHEKGITIKMNNLGGSVNHGLAIYDAIVTCENHVTVIAYGHVMSMGSIILQAADTRCMTSLCRMMLHTGGLSLGAEAPNFYKNVEEFKVLDEMTYEIYLKKINDKKPEFSKSQLKRKMATDWYLGPQEAIAYGLCDKVFTGWKTT